MFGRYRRKELLMTTTLTWIFAAPLIVWMAAAGLGTLMGHKMATDTFDRLGYSPRARTLAGITELIMAIGILIGAAIPDDEVRVVGIIAANLTTALTWFVIGGRGASRGDKVGAWIITFIATGYLIVLMF
jgi:hypothetical protein